METSLNANRIYVSNIETFLINVCVLQPAISLHINLMFAKGLSPVTPSSTGSSQVCILHAGMMMSRLCMWPSSAFIDLQRGHTEKHHSAIYCWDTPTSCSPLPGKVSLWQADYLPGGGGFQPRLDSFFHFIHSILFFSLHFITSLWPFITSLSRSHPFPELNERNADILCSSIHTLDSISFHVCFPSTVTFKRCNGYLIAAACVRPAWVRQRGYDRICWKRTLPHKHKGATAELHCNSVQLSKLQGNVASVFSFSNLRMKTAKKRDVTAWHCVSLLFRILAKGRRSSSFDLLGVWIHFSSVWRWKCFWGSNAFFDW